MIAENGKFVNGTHVTWIDVYAEEGYAHIYFGDFGGLSESDVQNDYFGNFGEEEGWTKQETIPNDNSGRTFDPSENAYSFLRVEAGDGAVNSKVHAHYNFNVLEDLKNGETVTPLINVFNATGYASAERKNVVLHNNLYGDGELTDEALKTQAEKDDLILKPDVSSQNDSKITKDLIFGNGYQVNIKVLRDKITDGMLNKGKENTGNGTDFGTIYNVNIKGNNPHTDVSTKEDRMLFRIAGAYYSEIQYYSKMNPKNSKLFLKNALLRNVGNAAIQCYNNQSQELFFENVVIADCMRAISNEGSKVKMNFKGVFDVLNYSNSKDLQDKFKGINGSDLYASAITEEGGGTVLWEPIPGIKDAAKGFLEWFGSDGTVAEVEHRYYVNVIFTNYMGTNNFFYWDEEKKAYCGEQESESRKMKFSQLKYEAMGLGITINSFDVSNMIDGGNEDHTSRDMTKLFTTERNTRLLCQYKNMKDDNSMEKNESHILWHMQQIYRDVEKIKDRKDHIEDLTESLKGVTWKDGSGVDQDGKPYGPNEKQGEVVEPQALLPQKWDYAD